MYSCFTVLRMHTITQRNDYARTNQHNLVDFNVMILQQLIGTIGSNYILVETQLNLILLKYNISEL